jgi:hypothetical protein
MHDKKLLNNRDGGNATCWACPNKIVTFHSNTISEGKFVVGFNGKLERRNLKSKRKRHIDQGTREIHGIW